MNYMCLRCTQLFPSVNKSIEHMKKYHSIVDGVTELKCILKKNRCTKYFYTFNGLKKHVRDCEKKSLYEEVCNAFEYYFYHSL